MIKIAQVRRPGPTNSLPTLPPRPFYSEDTKKLKPLVLQFEKTIEIFEKISNLCLELGDDSLAIEFQNKSKKIQDMLVKLSSQ